MSQTAWFTSGKVGPW